MQINPKIGIDKLIFGMKQKDVVAIYGNPDKKFTDEDDNIIFIYNDLQLHLNFYEDEDFKLGYIIASNKDLKINENNVIGKKIDDLKVSLPNFKTWEKENFDLAENYFNEDNWIIFVLEFNQIVKVELGCIIHNDEFQWKFKK